MYSVVLVDDERLIVRGLKTVINWAELGCEVTGTAYDGAGGLELIRRLKPDIVLTDIRMPNMDGLKMLAALRSEYPRMQMSVLTAYRDFEYARQALNLGVCRYLLKPSSMDELVEAVRVMTQRLGARAGEDEDEEETDEAAEAGSFIVQRALSYMREHCADHMTLSDVADKVYVSQWHLSKLINRHTHQSFFELIGSMRAERARLLLADPSMRVVDVALAVGYHDVAHFSKSFKRVTGKTPVEYRASLAGRPEPDL
ncbi:MAG: response regulator [Clostridia bacterium]|nr:response regulator [Clostridia bacterium]